MLQPPQRRPGASAAGYHRSLSRVLMGTDDRAVREMERPVQASVRVGLALHFRQDAVTDPGSLPAIEPTGNRLPRAIALWQHAPVGASAHDPKDVVDDDAVVRGGTAGVGLVWWEQRTRLLPLRIRQVGMFHAGRRKPLPSLRTRPSPLQIEKPGAPTSAHQHPARTYSGFGAVSSC